MTEKGHSKDSEKDCGLDHDASFCFYLFKVFLKCMPFRRVDYRGGRDVHSSFDNERDRKVDAGRGSRPSWRDERPQSPPIPVVPIEAVLGPDTPKLRVGADAYLKDGPTSPVRRGADSGVSETTDRL